MSFQCVSDVLINLTIKHCYPMRDISSQGGNAAQVYRIITFFFPTMLEAVSHHSKDFKQIERGNLPDDFLLVWQHSPKGSLDAFHRLSVFK